MFGKRFATVCVALGSVFVGLSCQDTTDPVSPVEPQFAKPVKPPKPPPATEPVIQEFWVYDNPTKPGEQCIHFVVSGTFDGMGINVAYDHFFNGYQDLYDHYEYYFIGGPPRTDTEFREIEGLGVVGHEDHCFNGERDSKTDPFKYFMDYPSTSISVVGEDGEGETGYDPIALIPAVIIDDTGVRFFHPKGVVVGGDTLEADGVSEVTSIWDHDEDGVGETYGDVRSYAIWKGETAPGNIYVEDLSVSNVSCTLKYGKGKNRNTVLGATISLDADFSYGAASADVGAALPDPLDYWGQGRIRIFQLDATEAEMSEYLRTPYHDGVRSYSWTFDTQTAPGSMQVEFVLDYLFASGSDEAYDWVYDPGQNENGISTTAGYDDEGPENPPWNPVSNVSTTLYDGLFPVAHSGLETVVCH